MYCHLVLLADGRFLYTGGQYMGNNGVRPSVWDPATGAVTEVGGINSPDLRNQSASVLLPPAQDQRVMIVGGGPSDMHNMAMATADAAVVDLTQDPPVYQPVAPLHMGRMHLCATLLPDRTVLVNGGSEMEESTAEATLDAEIFDPGTGQWTHGAVSRVPRLYHSVALLTPDGRVVTAGSNPARRVEELRIEVYWPPYLFRGRRPTLALADGAAGYGHTIVATVAGEQPLRWMSLMRPGAGTHSADNEQRLVDLAFTTEEDGEVSVELPTNAAIAPPGWYMLFAVDEDGVPSDAAWLRLG